MNWLIWIGGGGLFIDVFAAIVHPANMAEHSAFIAESTMVWIWICWRFSR